MMLESEVRLQANMASADRIELTNSYILSQNK
jgi:hypothetical protein